MRIAIIGSGVSGLVCAHLLGSEHEVVLFESDSRPGGHTHTHHLDLAHGPVTLDTGFIVFNDRTYPLFTGLLAELGIESRPSDMSFSVTEEASGIEWRGTSLSSVFAQRSNLVRPSMWRMLGDIGRFHRQARSLIERGDDSLVTLRELLAVGTWSPAFLDRYLVPLGSAIWSAEPDRFLDFPAATVATFFERHGLLSLGDHPRWQTIRGGSDRYVEAILHPLRQRGALRLSSAVEKIARNDDGVEVISPLGSERFDHVVIASHSDDALRLLADPDRLEREVLGSIRYVTNSAVLHTDTSVMPSNRRAWASWNYRQVRETPRRATLTYWLNQLEGLDYPDDLLLTLNQDEAIDPATVISTMTYAHPVLDARAIAAQRRHSELNGNRRTSFAGAYWGFGFHEDGVRSAVEVCRALGARR